MELLLLFVGLGTGFIGGCVAMAQITVIERAARLHEPSVDATSPSVPHIYTIADMTYSPTNTPAR